MSIFAPDAIPEWVRVTLFWLGVALLLLGSVAALLHFRPRGWFGRNVSWRFRLRQPGPLANAEENGEAKAAEETVAERFTRETGHAVTEAVEAALNWKGE